MSNCLFPNLGRGAGARGIGGGIKKTNVDYFTNETFQVAVRIEWPALRLIDVKITGAELWGQI
jgi:hypothetical protein